MKYNFSKEWCEKMAQLENGHEVGAGILAKDPLSDVEICPVCRNSDLERSWCSYCDKVGLIKADNTQDQSEQ